MLKCLLLRQWRLLICLAVLFCLLLLTMNKEEDNYSRTGYRNREMYLSQYSDDSAETLFVGLHTDYKEIVAVITAIEQFRDYDGEIPDIEPDIMDMLTGQNSYMTYDMLVWREERLETPGEYTDTIEYDRRLLSRLRSDLSNQENFDEIIENQREIMLRGIRRGGKDTKKYQKVLDNLNGIDVDFPVRDPYYVAKILTYVENDWYILALLAFMMFSAFSSTNQQKMTNQILISQYGMRKFAKVQITSSMIVSCICMMLYYLGMILILCEWNVQCIPWNHPIQILVGYENNLQNMTVLEYMFTQVGIKMLFSIGVVSIVLFISSLSKNNIVSFIGTLFLFCCIYMLGRTSQFNSWVIGNGRRLFEGLCYVDIGIGLVPYAFIFCVIVFGVTGMLLSLTIVNYEYSARRWVK